MRRVDQMNLDNPKRLFCEGRGDMNYLLLSYEGAPQWETASSGEREGVAAAFQASESALAQGGYLVASACLPGSDTPLRLRVRNGRLSLRTSPAPAGGQLV